MKKAFNIECKLRFVKTNAERTELLLIIMILASGSIATLISGIHTQDLSLLGESVTGYGLPLSWLRKVATVYPTVCNQVHLLDLL